MVHPNDGLCPQRNFQSLYYSPERWRDTPCSKTAALPLHTLTVSLPVQYNTISSWFTMLSFIGEIPWEKILGLTQYHGSAILLANTHPKKKFQGRSPRTPVSQGHCPQTPRQGEWVYSTPRLQSQLNNISRARKLGSTTNIFHPRNWLRQEN